MKAPWWPKMKEFIEIPDKHKEEVRKSIRWLAAGLSSYFLVILLLMLAGMALPYFIRG